MTASPVAPYAGSPVPGIESTDARPGLSAAIRGARITLRCEWVKLWHQLMPRSLLLACLAGPFGLLLALRVQGQLPRDTLFGRWTGQSGLAIPLLVLGFAQMWAFPVLAGILGGDVFAGEDRLGTWDLLLTRSRGKGEVFAGKVLSALAATVAALTALAAGSIVAGLIAGGDPLVALDGAVLHGRRALATVAACWLTALLPTLAFTALALMLSAISRSGIVGVGGPVVVGLVLQLLALVDTGPLVHRLLPTTPFDAWHALATAQPDWHPALRGSALSLAYLAACLAVAGVVFLRRDES